MKKAFEDLVRNNLGKFEGIFQNSPDAIIVTDSDGKILLSNQQTEVVFGYSREELYNKHIEILIPPRFQPHHSTHRQDYYQNPKRRMMGEGRELFGLKKDGSEFHAEIALSPLTIENEVFTVSIVRDISERKYSEYKIKQLNEELEKSVEVLKENTAKFESIFQNSPDAIVVTDHYGRIIQVNNQTEVVFGYRADELVFQPIEVLVPVRFREHHKHHRDYYYNNPRRRLMGEGMELFARRKDGSEFYTEIALSPFELNGAIYTISIVRDISARKNAEMKITQLNRDLQEHIQQLSSANNELESFSYSISHDLRAPLRAINGYTNILLEDFGTKIDEGGKQVMDAIVRNSSRMGQLIDDLLAFSRLGRKEIVKGEINMNGLVGAILSETRGNASVHVSEIPNAFGDFMLLRQVWANLISNAFKYTHKTPDARIEINGEAGAQENLYFIKDNGVGFDMAYYSKLFGVFQRLHTVNEFEGTGVGLAIVQRIVQRHGGRTWAKSEVGNGATFYFTLPNMN